MQYKCLVITFLLSSFPIYAMELTITNDSNGIPLTDDLFTTLICSRLDRSARDTLRCTNKKYSTLVHSQEELNKHYWESLIVEEMFYWKSLGALEEHQEFAYAVKNKKDKLAKWLLERNEMAVWDAYCLNIEDAVETSTVDEMVPVIRWLLYTRKPTTHLGEFESAYGFTLNLKKYPDVQKFIDLFKTYEQREEGWKIQRERERILSLAWHSWGEYYYNQS